MSQRRKFLTLGLALVLAFTVAGSLWAQGVQRSTLRGKVTDSEGDAIPGVTVTVESEAMQGQRSTITGTTGEFILRGLEPGLYTVSFELEGMQASQREAVLTLGQIATVDATMTVEALAETIVVTSELPTVLANSEVSTTYTFEDVNALPVRGRAPNNIADLAPGVTDNTPNAGQVTISGGFAYDNIWLIDGVDADDNLFGTTNPVFIEDAISDVQVLTSGISAEYGRFSGGVVNVLTKSGGNEFSGTFRASLTNDDWRTTTPREDRLGTVLQDDISKIYSATLGGYLWKDRLWFFLSGRDQSTSTTGSMVWTGLPRITAIDETRYEYKLTANILDEHQIQGTYTEREQVADRADAAAGCATPQCMVTWTLPAELTVARYSGVLTPSIFAELQYSEKKFAFTFGDPPASVDLVRDSPFWDDFGDLGVHYHAPHWDTTDPEDRNNEQLAASMSFFLDTASVGSHDLKVGYEDFNTYRTGGNSQSPTDYQMIANPLQDANGDPVLTADNDLIPVWEAFSSGAWQFVANRDARVDITTKSFYVNDRWQLNDHWSFNVGARYEDVGGESKDGITVANTSAFVPRLAASYDLRGDGKYRFDATYAQYAGKYSESQFASNTNVGNPDYILQYYIGPYGTGYDFAPGWDFDNTLVPGCDTSSFGAALATGCNYYAGLAAGSGTQNVIFDPDLHSPIVSELTLSAGMELKRGGFLKMVYTNREYSDFVETFVDTTTGTSEVIVLGVSAGIFSNTVYENSDIPKREYEAVQFIGRYRLTDNWTLDGNYTYQITNDGNFEGEGSNRPGISSTIGNYPEMLDPRRHYPDGHLDDYAPHKLRLWTVYDLGLGRAGNMTFGLLAKFDSGRTFSKTHTIPLTDIQQDIIDALYVDSPTSQTLYFEDRGTVEFADTWRFDLSVNYMLPIFKDFEVWIKGDITNVLNDDTQIAGRSDVRSNFNGPLDSLGLPTTYTYPSGYKGDRGNADYQLPREYQLTLGFRF